MQVDLAPVEAGVALLREGEVLLQVADRRRDVGRPCAALQNRLDAKSLCHHDAHRFSVRRLTPTISRNLWSRFADTVALSALNTTTTGPKNTLRPRNRTDGGVTRRRQPSRSQQKLCRHMLPASISPGPPRGLRG